MSSKIASGLILIFIIIFGLAAPYGKAESQTSGKTDEQGEKRDVSARVIRADDIPADRLRPLPANAEVVRHYAGGPRGAPAAMSTGDSEELIYSNWLGARFYPPGTMIRIADDIHTEAIAECELTQYLIRVLGGVEGGGGEFDVIVSLFDRCPSSLPWDAPAIPGTEVRFTGLSDAADLVHELGIDYSDPNIGICDDTRACRIDAQDCLDGSACAAGPPVVIPPSVWLRVEFSTDEAGWIVGAPATRGFSADRYSHIFAGCDAWFGGYPLHPHASFYAELFGADSCETHFVAYMTPSDSSIPAFDVPPGTSYVRLADDIELAVDQCELSTLEIAVKGTAGAYEIDFDVRENLQAGAIPGSERTFVSREGGGLGELEIARLTFDPGLFVDRDFWITWQANKPRTGLINAGRTLVGSSRHIYAAYNHPDNPGEWAEYVTADGTPAIFHVTAYCRGEAPLGACCPDQPDAGGQDVVCIDNVIPSDCAEMRGRWIVGGTCPEGHNDPNDPWLQLGQPPCGTHACCKPDNNCANLSREECIDVVDSEGRPSWWFPGRFCGGYGFRCPFFACFYAQDDCVIAWDPWVGCNSDEVCADVHPDSFCQWPEHMCWVPRGCNDIYCCDWVCRDPSNQFCCDVAWDSECAAAYADCPGQPGNDECWGPTPGLGAYEIHLEDIGGGVYQGTRETDHTDATFNEDDPGFCCHNRGVDRPALATLWYKFRPVMDGTVRIHTCGSPGAEDAQDSLIQVFRVDDSDLGICADGTPCRVSFQDCADLSRCVFDEKTVCENLEIIGCNDDGPNDCGAGAIDGNSDVCVRVNEGVLYYVVVGAGSPAQTGVYRLSIEQPCDDPQPPHSFCSSAMVAPPPPGAPNGPFSVPFDLAYASIHCPGEPCVQTMKNDIWFEHQANCTGRLRVETCGALPEDPDPDTTLAVYHGETCPPGEPLGCNDDAVIDAENHELRNQWCEFGGNDCDTDDDCEMVCQINHNPCAHDSECDVGDCADGSSCSVSAQDCLDASVCLRIEWCVADVCISDCGSASSVIVPVIQSEYYRIRLGGFMGGTPSGEMTIECIPEDCNFNGLPDILDIQEGRSEDCNFNDVPDECDIYYGESEDCQLNEVPDECEIFIGVPGCTSWCICACVPDRNGNCIPDVCEVTGACCREGLPCDVLNPEACSNLGGEYRGNDTTCDPDPCVAANANFVSSVPAHDGSLWRSQNNVVRMTFDAAITAPAPGQVVINEILPGGYCGPDLSASFTFDVESGTVLRIQDTGATLEHRRWYAFRNVGNWPGVEPFEIQYVVQIGDCDGNGLVISLDVGCVVAGIPCFVNCGDDNRKDIDGDGRVISLDVGVVNAHIGSFAITKPTGHNGDDGGECLEPARVLETDPPDNRTLWRTHNNSLRITFDADITAPQAGEVEILELHRCGWVVGSDLSPSFTFDVEDDANGNPRVLRIQENGSVLKHCAKYCFRNVGNWKGVAGFEFHHKLAIGDADGNGMVISPDVGAVIAGIPCFANCGEDNRLDIDGDGRVISLDVGHVNAHISSCFPDTRPCPHDNEAPD